MNMFVLLSLVVSYVGEGRVVTMATMGLGRVVGHHGNIERGKKRRERGKKREEDEEAGEGRM